MLIERRIATLEGRIRAEQGRLSEAEAAFHRALALEVPGRDRGLRPLATLYIKGGLAEVQMDQNRPEEALATFREMATLLTDRAGTDGRGRSEVNENRVVFRYVVRLAWQVETERPH